MSVSYTHLDVYKRQVFTRWYAYETRINDIFGDYEVSHKELS